MGSVANTPEIDAAAGIATTRPNPVALETLVTVTGARPSSEGARDLFTEETRTILVFVDGAVIQLNSPVSEGQLLFLTSKKSNEEVVCQVLQKRKTSATSCYVELQFTEEKSNYWGVSYPKGKKRGAEFSGSEQVAAERTTERDAAATPPVRNEKDVEELKTQVDALRKQLAELEKEKRNATEAAEKATAGRRAEEHDAKATEDVDSAQQANATPSAGQSLLMPPASPDAKKSPGWTVPMALPMRPQAAADATETEAEGLPKPELDFSHIPPVASAEDIAARASLKHLPSRWRDKMRMAGLLVVLAAVGFGAYERLSPFVGALRNKPVSVNTAARAEAPKPVTAAKPAPTGTAATPVTPTVPSAAAGSAPVVSEKPNAPDANGAGAKKETGNVAPQPVPAVASKADEAAAAPEKPPVENLKKASVARERLTRKPSAKESPAETAPVEVVPSDAPIVQAKLVHAAAPVYPPDAMRSYITGDVKAELVVEATGKVGEVKVISGPAALRDAAVEALKKYEYAPATQGGKNVASKTTAVVKFWFNP